MRQPGLFAYFSSQHAASEEDWATEALTFVLADAWRPGRPCVTTFCDRSRWS